MDTFYFPPKLKRSWLVQRLQKPLGTDTLAKAVGCLSFGGGLRNGGLSDEAMALLQNLFSFDYMGSAEFEYGIVPSTLGFIVSEVTNMVTGEVKVPGIKGPTVYYICHKDHQPEIEERLTLLVKDPPDAKETIGLQYHFKKPYASWEPRTFGWLDCSNGLMFFVDKDMWENTCTLFLINK